MRLFRATTHRLITSDTVSCSDPGLLMKSLKIKKAFAFDRHFEPYKDFSRLPV